jgi:hypothetical protein
LFEPDLDHIYLLPLGDFHVGDPSGLGGTTEEGHYATKKFHRMIDWIKEKDEAYTFLMGDLFDSVTKTSLGNVYEQTYNLKTAKEYLHEELKPIKHKIIGAISGNHENRIEQAIGDNPVDELAYRLGIDYFPNWCAYLFLGVGESRSGEKKDRRRPIVYTMFLHHMTGGGRTKGGKLNRVAILKDMVLADIYCGAHVHLKGAFKGKYLYPDSNNYKVREQQQTYVATGSFMGYAGYSIRGQYDKPSTGAVRIRMNGESVRGKDTHANV